MTVTCRYHCRACGCHFTSLAAFDAHRQGPHTDRRCEFPEKNPLNELSGVCRLADSETRLDVTVYEHESAQRARTHFSGGVA